MRKYKVGHLVRCRLLYCNFFVKRHDTKDTISSWYEHMQTTWPPPRSLRVNLIYNTHTLIQVARMSTLHGNEFSQTPTADSDNFMEYPGDVLKCRGCLLRTMLNGCLDHAGPNNTRHLNGVTRPA